MQDFHAADVHSPFKKADDMKFLASVVIKELKHQSVLVQADVFWSKNDNDHVTSILGYFHF